MNNTATLTSSARRTKADVQLQPHDLRAAASELPRTALPHPGEPVRSLRSGDPPDGHPDVQLQEPWSHQRRRPPLKSWEDGQYNILNMSIESTTA
jgi:hypothetical protein